MMRWSYLALAAAGLVLGCGGAPEPAAVGDADAGSAAAVPEGPGLAGVLQDETGRPLGNEMVLACMAKTCLYGKSGPDGRFFFAIQPPAEVALKTPEVLSGGERRGATLCPVVISDRDLVDLGAVHVPRLPEGAPIAWSPEPQTLRAGDGLELTLRHADLTPRIGDVLVDVAARAIAAERMPEIPALAGREIVAMYALHPFAAESSSPVAVRASSSLPPGTAVELWTISEIDGRLSEPTPGHADGDAITTDPGGGIHELTWLVITR